MRRYLDTSLLVAVLIRVAGTPAAKSYLALASQALAVIPECLEKNLLGAMIDFVLTRDK